MNLHAHHRKDREDVRSGEGHEGPYVRFGWESKSKRERIRVRERKKKRKKERKQKKETFFPAANYQACLVTARLFG